MMKNPPHPGRIIKGELDELDVSVAAAATSLGVTRSQLHRVVKGESSISPEMAYRLEVAIGSTADAWMRMQVNYDLAQVRQRASAIKAKKIARPEPA